ncbi:carotenoid ester lipase precursor [Agrocybe pediades]|nr:carotenoid ester lipase precursor [Agrocybe pediades]
MTMISRVLLAGLAASYAYAAPSALSGPTVKLGDATFVGANLGTTQRFLGIPFAQPPVGNLRFRLPQPITYTNGTYDATDYGLSCGQQSVDLPIVTGLVAEAADFLVDTIFGKVFPDQEDCLTINIVKPKSATSKSKLPVVVWIFGGGFELGSTSMYDGGLIVGRSQAIGQPVVYVSMNYRLNGFGFLSSKEVKEAGVGNLGLHDQREALRWIQKYIGQFGGDPSKVTIWGESAGAISVSLQMLANGGNTEGLFRAGFMQSGAPIPVGDITHGQKYYDSIVKDTGCTSAKDTLQCLREVPYQKLKDAINNTPSIFAYQSLNLAWLPRTDGVFLTDDPLKLVQQGKVAQIPYITGNCDDEGTLFSLANLNVTTDAQFKTYLKNTFLPGIPDSAVDQIAKLYPSDVTQGSPFGTGIFNALTPQFKRLAAFQGDGVFQAPRRWLLQYTASKQNVWVFISKRLKSIPILGSAHFTDIINSYGGGEMEDHLIRFANTLDPNPVIGYQWPKYNLATKKVATYVDGLIPVVTGTDDFREEAMKYLTEVTLAYPV